jgi:hypothetical protein
MMDQITEGVNTPADSTAPTTLKKIHGDFCDLIRPPRSDLKPQCDDGVSNSDPDRLTLAVAVLLVHGGKYPQPYFRPHVPFHARSRNFPGAD